MESNVSTHLHVYRRVIEQRGATSSVPSTLLILHELEVSYTFRCVFSDWGRLVLRSDLHPTRPRFGQQAYVATLKEQCSTPEAEIPEFFRMYIFEWLARMGIGCMRPGLLFFDFKLSNIQRQFGINYLAYSSRLVVLVFKHQRW